MYSRYRSSIPSHGSFAPVEPTNLERAEPFVTADGSTIREVAGPVSQPTANQSLAEATVPPGGATAEHFHPKAEEIYFFTAGAGGARRRGGGGGGGGGR